MEAAAAEAAAAVFSLPVIIEYARTAEIRTTAVESRLNQGAD
jgi:hypothetical protein